MRNVKTTFLQKWFDEVWNNGDESAIDKLMSDESTAHGISHDSAAGFKVFFRDFKNQFHNIKVSVDDVVAQDGIEAARTSVTATHTASGKHVNFSGMCMVKLVDGKIAEAWNNYDFLNMYQQLGQKLVPVE